MKSEKTYKYETCPHCGKKLFRIVASSLYHDIFIWCRNCKKEILFRANEPKS